MTKRKIVLTGGPGGGKTSAAQIIQREFPNSVTIVPEAATILYSGGFPRAEKPDDQIFIQKAIFSVQDNLESLFLQKTNNETLFCDRGTLDGLAYWPLDKKTFFKRMQTSMKDELARYDAVIFFETAAAGNCSIRSGNAVRTEDNSLAVELDKKLFGIWSQHANFHHIPHHQSFAEKLRVAVNTLKKLL